MLRILFAERSGQLLGCGNVELMNPEQLKDRIQTRGISKIEKTESEFAGITTTKYKLWIYDKVKVIEIINKMQGYNDNPFDGDNNSGINIIIQDARRNS